jgi:hypothetical protein
MVAQAMIHTYQQLKYLISTGCSLRKPIFIRYTSPTGRRQVADQRETPRPDAARVKVVVASVMQPTVEYDQHPNASL